ncbi:MarR family transcriptional regulator [Pseudomaricurvus alkylphenolicus]|uniref:MarR family winged helix-turn-helix transcriptional regulator n=1 Tax=Pseudomaricurvus alkylphenolicus TaxID=1306991 RepID=UPI001424393A|nr:MarR family transcriptional regulator [Pseudomaricurvus alkylphenolicus]NIB43921.1 MarR family transcriptional regulator [Pseudomaricurvus alkylphenolicus]
MTDSDLSRVLTLERFFPYRLSILSNTVSGIIADTYKDKFAISITEWRIMAVLGEYPGISADEVSLKTHIEKSIISRAVSKLLQRKLIEREFDPEDRRRSMLQLSPTGKSVYNDVVPTSYEYEEKLLCCFNDEERRQFSDLIDRLHQHAGALQDDEQHS